MLRTGAEDFTQGDEDGENERVLQVPEILKSFREKRSANPKSSSQENGEKANYYDQFRFGKSSGMKYEVPVSDHEGRRDTYDQGRSDDQGQKAKWCFQIIELEDGCDKKSLKSPGIGTQAIIVGVATAQIPNAQHVIFSSPRRRTRTADSRSSRRRCSA